MDDDRQCLGRDIDAIVLFVQCLLIFGLSLGIYHAVKCVFVSTSLDNIPGPPSQSFVKGNMEQYRDFDSAVEFQLHLVDDYDAYVVRLHSLFNRPSLYVYDPTALHTILVKDGSIWEQTPHFVAANGALFGPGLLATLGDQHRRQRKMINPVFSANHMRFMLPMFYGTARRLRDAIKSRVENGPQELDMANWMGRTALELIGQGGLGYSFDKLVDDKKYVLAESMKRMFPSVSKLGVLPLFLPQLRAIVPAGLRGPLASIVPIAAARDMKYNSDFVAQKMQDIYDSKKRALQQGDEAVAEQIGQGKDIMMKANMHATEKDGLSEYELVSQMSILVLAAMDTTSNTLSRILLILAERPDVQQRLRAEVIEASQGEDLSYDRLMQLPFLDAVCRETLRLYPPLQWSGRVATQNTVVPVSKPIRGIDGKLITQMVVPKGTEVLLGVIGCNTSKAFWGEDALDWKPERWLAPLPESVTKAGLPGVTANLMSFLGGRRACIGFMFAEMEMKVVLVALLQSFVFSPSDTQVLWIPSPVFYPAVNEDRTTPRMPLQVSAYHQ